MGFNLFRWLRGRNQTTEVKCTELEAAAVEYAIRNLSFQTCVNLVANAMGRCEFRTFWAGKEVFDREYYLWNVEPNVNQNSTMFVHRMIQRLFADNEVLMIAPKRKDGFESIVIVESFQSPDDRPIKQNRYKGVVAGGVTYDKTFLEQEVLHLRLHDKAVSKVIDAMYGSFYRMVAAAMRDYEWNHGQHWTVAVSQLAQGADDFTAKFTQMLQEQVRPFLTSNTAVLPIFDGYEYKSVSGSGNTGQPDEVRAMVEDIFNWTARAFQIPFVLIGGKVEATGDAESRFLTSCIDPICDQLGEEITRKRYGYDGWRQGNYLRVDSSAIRHFDLFGNAANVEKLVGSGAFSVNDVLRAAGCPPIDEPWADQHFLTKNIADIKEAATALESRKEQ